MGHIHKHCPACGQFIGISKHSCVGGMKNSPANVFSSPRTLVQDKRQENTAPTVENVYEIFHSTLLENEDPLEQQLVQGQLPFFLTAEEIRKHYQGHDGDRHPWEEDEIHGEEQFFERKLMESQYRDLDGQNIYDDEEKQEYEDGFLDYPHKKWTLVEDITVNGVIYPVSLQVDYSRKGAMGRPEILGGHHRVAVAQQYRPNDFIHVVFYDSAEEARKDLGYQY